MSKIEKGLVLYSHEVVNRTQLLTRVAGKEFLGHAIAGALNGMMFTISYIKNSVKKLF